MSRIISVCHLTLDGVMQAPGRADEDPRGGFTHGGWATPYNDPVMGQAMGQSMGASGALLLGRRTYQDFFSVWPARKDNSFSAILTNTTKYVASRTLGEPLPWENSILLPGDAADGVAKLKAQEGKDLVILGSGALVRSLTARGLIDQFLLTIHPLVLGQGTRLFPADGPYARLELVDAKPSTTGVVVATYRPG